MKTAKEFGADFTLLVNNSDKPTQQAKTIREMLGAYPDRTIDCSGFESSVQLAVEVSKIRRIRRKHSGVCKKNTDVMLQKWLKKRNENIHTIYYS